jgi:hypothetical protein
MLINKGYSEGDIVCFKLVNGDEVVAKIVEQSDTGFKISKPCTVLPSAKGLGLMQSLMSADINTVTLNNSHVMLHAPVVSEMENYYIEMTTGIKPITRGGIIT